MIDICLKGISVVGMEKSVRFKRFLYNRNYKIWLCLGGGNEGEEGVK